MEEVEVEGVRRFYFWFWEGNLRPEEGGEEEEEEEEEDGGGSGRYKTNPNGKHNSKFHTPDQTNI